MPPCSSASLAFEHALAELERILRSLEDGTTTLEQSLELYEQGVALLRGCYLRLRDAEQRILKITGMDGDGKPVLQPFEHSATLDESRPETKGAPGRTKNKSGDASY
jgi:exodeoxyribonuclease VII small subunit